jgi:hypothetical protein
MSALERRYRRLLLAYPRAFRREHGDEILTVLLDTAGTTQRWPALADVVDLIRAALWARLRPRIPRSAVTVRAAVKLLYAGAVAELIAVLTIIATTGDIRAAILQRHPHYTTSQWHAEVAHQIVPLEISGSMAILVWLLIARASGAGRRWARWAMAVFFLMTSQSLARGLTHGSAIYAPADLTAGGVLWIIELAALRLLFASQSRPHFRKQ